jgi:hypothetical protein
VSVVVGRAALGCMVLAACGLGRGKPKSAPVVAKTRLAVLPAESDSFPKVAEELSRSLASARVAGVDDMQLSKVSLEVVQLSIECVDPTTACYSAVGKSLNVNKLLFAQLASTSNSVTVTLSCFFFSDASAAKKTAEKVFANEAEASAGVAGLVAEATQP